MNHAVVVCLLVLLAAVAAVSAAENPYLPTDAERARWTLQDMRSWKIALEAYRLDHQSYPKASTLQEAAAAIQPVYISAVPMNDAWGRPYIYEATESGFVLVSPGADGEFDRSTWIQPGQLDSLNADAVVSDQAKFWLRSWKFR